VREVQIFLKEFEYLGSIVVALVNTSQNYMDFNMKYLVYYCLCHLQ